MIHRFLILGIYLICLGSLLGANWPQFRGPETTSVATGETLPTTITADNVVWKTPLPGRGLSGAVIIGDRVFLTACTQKDQDRLHVLCFDARSGKKLWERETWATGRTMCHSTMSVAAPHAASDGQRIFAFFSSNDLVCYDFDGNLQWLRGLTHDYQNASNSLGMASSPLVVGDVLVVQVECDSESQAVGIDVRTGVNRWKIPRPQVSNWSSPTLYHDSSRGTDLVLLQSAENLVAVEPANGQTLWKVDGVGSTIPTSTVSGKSILVPSKNGLTALNPNSDGTPPTKLWSSSKLSPGTASPIAFENFVLTVKPGVFSCGRADTGATLWQMRVEGKFSSTPIVVGSHIYAFNENGSLFVVHPTEKKGELVSRFELSETILATPAVSNNALYIRSDQHLWKFAAKP